VSADDGAGLDAALLERVAVLRGQECQVEPLPGGLTNKNYKVSTTDGTYVLRHSTPSSADELAVDRRAEYENSVRAAAAGVGAPVVEFLPEDGVLVIGFLEGATLSDEHLQRRGMMPRLAEACRRLHAGPPFVNRFDMFELQPEYLARVQRRGFRLPRGYLDHAEAVDRVRAALAVRPVALRPCHNDLLAANFIDEGHTVWIIDYEYSGNNDPYFELGNIWSECHLTREQL
jgi:thiamine kinase-like enzyme